ncbi:polyphosphate kinase 1 [Fluviicola taffensis]|uniref:Polyphosphate kinase n=1 Tax=Fluviicola taffensis (strain DSM 16823 / NCIMB 13979 / RW262) TaxID=755732 RepID=F2IEE6_FLUTR|nr:polyphosphate kinase 1 [Fluviicola taffensis]AEA43470.1 polyphosphate kinase 1 [Fluviicola taffensis DSM 16823]
MKYFNRELSWLAFNDRVLQEALDDQVPLVERMRFLGIYSNNLDEFYRVRVANIKRMIQVDGYKVDGYKGTAEELYEEIRNVVIKQQRKFEHAYASILHKLKLKGIKHFNENTVTELQKKELKNYFFSSVIHDIVPVLLDKKMPFPRLRDKAIYLAVRMEWDSKRKARYALIEIPNLVSRFYILESEKEKGVILIDDIIRLNLADIFPIFSFDTIEAFTFKFTRDAELNLDDDVSMSFIEKMEKSIKQRKKGEPVRMVYDHRMPQDLLEMLIKSLNLTSGINTIAGGKYHNFKDFMKFPDFGNTSFVYRRNKPADHPDFYKQPSLIKVILEKDVMLHYPYHRFDHLVDLLREAAIDPKVASIKINIYRVAKNSQVMNALVNAVRNGKEVTVVLELQARFDEENNLFWSERMKEEGAKVLYGPEHLKIHSKLIQIKRISDKKEQLITYVGTGNFNEQSAQIYTDLGLITVNKKIAEEVLHVFHMMEHPLHHYHFKNLIVSPINARKKYLHLINNETKNAKNGLPAYIHIKINNLVDSQLIDKLYEASQYGVKIKLMIRGICCLVPGIKGLSENIEILSVVDRFLEHTRYLVFGNNNKPQYFISSADWMERNLDKRIEVGAPILDKRLQEKIKFIFALQWSDREKARIIDKLQRNNYKEAVGNEAIIRSQEELQSHYHQLIEELDTKNSSIVQ